MLRNQRMKNIFADKATFIIRRMMQEPKWEWVVRDFLGSRGVSQGMAQGVLETMAKKGYVERVKKGPGSYTILTNRDMLITDWLKQYDFEFNEIDSYYSPDRNILRKIKEFFKESEYALTLHTGANLITSFVKMEDVFIYLKYKEWNKDVLRLRQKLELKELVKGGDFHIIKPYYKNTVFFNSQKIRGYSVVSNLQLYLDLYNFQPRGREHAEYLRKSLKEEGKDLD